MKTIFTKHPRVLNMRGFWTYQSSEYASRSKDARVLNIPRILICLWFWICQGSEQTRVLNMLGLTGFWICLNMLDYVWLNMTGYVWTCRYMREYAQICLNGFCFIFPYCNALSPWTRAYLFQRLHKTRSFRLKENDAVFLETQTLIFL